MLMTAVACIDDRESGSAWKQPVRSTLFRMTHSSNICVAGNDADGICNTLTFGSGAGIGRRKTKYDCHLSLSIAASKLKTGSCTWFIEKSSDFFTITGMCVFLRIHFNVFCQVEDLFYFFHRKVQGTHQMSHRYLLCCFGSGHARKCFYYHIPKRKEFQELFWNFPNHVLYWFLIRVMLKFNVRLQRSNS